MRFDPGKFTAPKAKPLPVFLLLDVSGSMSASIDPETARRTGHAHSRDGAALAAVEVGESKIQILNGAVRRMIDALAAQERMETEFLVSIITFGDSAVEHLGPSAASSVNWTDMTAGGSTAMGAAFSMAKRLIERTDIVPSRAYRPTVILVSDGQPTDDWQRPLEALIADGRSSKCFFVAMGIGEGPVTEVLERFISRTPVLAEVNGVPLSNSVFHAADAHRIHEFFSRVTMSVTTRRMSVNPSDVPKSTLSASEQQGEHW